MCVVTLLPILLNLSWRVEGIVGETETATEEGGGLAGTATSRGCDIMYGWLTSVREEVLEGDPRYYAR